METAVSNDTEGVLQPETGSLPREGDEIDAVSGSGQRDACCS